MSDTKDLVQRLRAHVSPAFGSAVPAMHEAADTIERLTAALAAQAEAHAADLEPATPDEVRLALQETCDENNALRAEVERLTAERDALTILLGDMASALEYHQELTRPIHSTKVALDAYRAARTGSA